MRNLYPLRKPYRKGYLRVSDGCQIYYHLYGNQKGKPVLYLHGGPGAGTKPGDAKYFNPRTYNVVLFDQRGAGKSRPFASTKANTTWKLVDDITALLDHLGIKKVFLFGGSWGSTLALVYAIKNPKRITGMLLRGIFLSTREEKEAIFSQGGYSANLFPDAWERFASHAPKKLRKDYVALTEYYISKMHSQNSRVSDKYRREWFIYEVSMLALNMTKKDVDNYLRKGTYKAMAPFEAHYYGGRNLCFLSGNFIEKNARRLSRIPTVIVHGRYDALCMPASAWKLHKMLPKSKIYFIISGHHPHDKTMALKLKEEMDKFAKILK